MQIRQLTEMEWIVSMSKLDYCGTELDVFIHAKNWKKYWASAIKPYLGDNVLDVGAGIGATASNLNIKIYNRWVELEPDNNLTSRIEESQRRGEIPPHFEIRNGTSNDLGADEIFDTILYIDVLEHIKEDAEELLNVSKNLTINGHLIIVAPAHNFLFTEFDRQIGHFRRYDKKSLISITPEKFEIVKLCYLDSVGMIASLANKLILKSGSPKISQIKLWDKLMVRASRVVDGILFHRVGKSIVCILRKAA